MPQITAPGWDGERNSDWVMSPIPLVLLSNTGSGWLITGMIVREITFQSEPNGIGMTGWMLRMFCTRLNGPVLKLMLFWNGRLIKFATGFCDALASASVSCASGDEGFDPASAETRLPNW